jgi:two-component system LytT family response regulator
MTGRMRIAIVDDEPLARSLLRELLAAHEEVEVVAECGNGYEAVKAVAELHPDLLLLDIQMPKLNGFEVLELIGREVPVIFVTAYDEYALKAFEVHAIDYLLKPVSQERLSAALGRASGRLGEAPDVPIKALMTDARAVERPLARVVIRDGAQVHVLPVDKIDYIEAQDDYACFRAEGKQYLKEQPLGELETLLDPGRFVRIYRSFILNVDRIARVERLDKDQRMAILRDGTRLPISRSGYARLNALL